MTDKNLTHLEFVLDRSGSMYDIVDDVRGGFAALVDRQRTEPGRCTVSLSQFDDEYEVVFSALPVEEVPPLDIHPRGTTAMLDAIGRSIVALGERLAAMDEDQRPGSVIVAIITDGMENASVEHTYKSVREMIARQEKEFGWTFMYLGADQDAIEVGAQMGIHRDLAMTYSRQNSARTYDALSESVSRYRGAVREGASAEQILMAAAFTDDERVNATA